MRSLLPLLLLLPLFVHVLKEDREAAAVSSRPKSSPEPPSFSSSTAFSSAANDVAIGGGDCPLSLPINTSRLLPRSDSRFKSLQMQRKEESRLPLSLWPACWPGQGLTRPAGRPPFVPRCCIASRHRRFTARLQTLASLDPSLPLAEPPPSSLKRKPGFKFHSQRVCSRKEAGIG